MLALLCLILYSHFSLATETCEHDQSNFRCVSYVRNYDADTITFNIPNVHPLIGQKINVRVSGVDTPEVKTKNSCEKNKARDARRLVESMLKQAKRIDLIKVQRDKYFRILADIQIDGQSLSHYLLKNGLAYSYDGGRKKIMDWCRSHREIASENAVAP